MIWIRIAISIVGFLLIGQFCKKKTDGFSIREITPRHQKSALFTMRSLTEEEKKELSQALGQPYSYYCRGGQVFAFLSADKKYVLKLFKQHLYHPSYVERLQKRRIDKRVDKLQRDFFSYKVAFEELLDVTGLVYVHLQPTPDLNVQLQIRDKLHILHTIDLNRFDFIIQKRAELVHDYIAMLMNTGKEEEAHRACSSLIDLICSRAKRGFRDRDPSISTNCGFLEGRAIKIDVGRFVKDPTICVREELIRTIAPFRDWIANTHPALLENLEQEINQI